MVEGDEDPHKRRGNLTCTTTTIGHHKNVGITNRVSMFQMYGKDSRSSYWESWSGLRLYRHHTSVPRNIRILYALVWHH